ncbi:MAG: methylmalonyl Co-A mutase-associated GTPase MeaB [Candidatus Eiseniibacteriota bacterium]
MNASPSVAPAVSDLVRRALAGDRVALARTISLVENEAPGAEGILAAAFPKTGVGVRIGVTGPPGAGKSTLTARLARAYREQGHSVAVVAVDPTSPFSGGALLGDRVRMFELSGDPGVFIRSMASRGSLGGLSGTTTDVCDVLEASGFARILIETVGVGQSELEVAETADTTLVVLVPESGDSVQALKAGLMEIGDVFAINKSDREGADRAAHAVRSMIHLGAHREGWEPPVVLTIAQTGQGVAELVATIGKHLEFLSSRGLLERRRRRRLEERIDALVQARSNAHYRSRVADARREEILTRVEHREITPAEGARILHGEAWPEAAGRGAATHEGSSR